MFLEKTFSENAFFEGAILKMIKQSKIYSFRSMNK